ncbi:MAG: hypothetical protein LC808_40350 [Actinobacteria bacterium]|nr:hypothetical protein [Actinomycetota bacterium]
MELSTQPGHNSVEIDSWQNVGKESNNLYMNTAGIYTELDAKLSIIDDSPDTTYSHCKQVTNWVSNVDFAVLHKGSQLCALSHTGRYAVLKVYTLPASAGQNDSFVFYGKTWQLPEQAPPAQPAPRQSPPPEAAPGQ